MKKKASTLHWALTAMALSFGTAGAHAQGPHAQGPHAQGPHAQGVAGPGVAEAGRLETLKDVFNTAWLRQPEARALASRRDAAQAQVRAAASYTPEPAAVEISQKSDRLSSNSGARETEVGLAIPLWLPGQRDASARVAQAEVSLLQHKQEASQLRLAAVVREAWWTWQRASLDTDLGQAQLANARRLAADVARREQAGDLARADRFQAEGVVAAAEAVLAQAQSASAAALAHVLSLTGGAAPSASARSSQSEPEPPAAPAQAPTHPAIAELQGRLELAEKAAALVATQRRGNPELTVTTTRDRGAYGERYGQALVVGVRLPLSAGFGHDARVATAKAEVTELQAQLALETDRLAAEQQALVSRVASARVQLQSAQRRAQLAKELRGFVDKAFRLGEGDLPNRLRIEAEAVDAERQESRSRIHLAEAISAWRQATGLLPE